MEKPRRTGVYLVAALIAALLIAWLVVKQTEKARLITQLGHHGVLRPDRTRDISIRIAAARTLLEAGKLEDSLAGLPIYKRSYTAQALGEIHTEESTRLLGILLRDQEEKPQAWAADALIKHGRQAIPTLMAALSAGGTTKDNAIRALVALGKDSAPRLRFLLADRGSYAAAAEALAKIGGIGTDALLKAAYCADNKVRAAAVSQLAAQKRPGALKAALDNLSSTDKLAQIDAAIAGLGVLADPAGAPALLPFLEKKDKRTAAATSLGLIGDPCAVEPLLAQIPAGDPPYRRAAVLALSRIGAPAVPALVRELKASDPVMRRSAAGALVGTRSAAATPALIAALSDSDALVRAPAARALGWHGNASAVDALVKALPDRDYHVVDAAVAALGEIGTGVIAQLLGAVASPSQSTEVRYQISQAFTIMGSGAGPQLVAALSSASPEVQKWSATALGGIRYQDAVPALKRLGAASAGDVRWVVEEQLRVLTGSTQF